MGYRCCQRLGLNLQLYLIFVLLLSIRWQEIEVNIQTVLCISSCMIMSLKSCGKTRMALFSG